MNTFNVVIFFSGTFKNLDSALIFLEIWWSFGATLNTEDFCARFPLAGSRLCIGLSIPGVIFLVIIGFMFDKQGMYTSVEVEDPDAAASECYFAGEARTRDVDDEMAFFFFTVYRTVGPVVI